MAGSPREGLKIMGLIIKRSITKKLQNKPDSDDESNQDESAPECPESYPNYRYEDLPGPSFIRLLTLRPGKTHDPIRCYITPADLKTCGGQYEALSYVWGAAEGHLRVQTDDAGFDIRPNLHRALADLRSPDKSRILWIDALCIDQANTSEKETQLPLMCEIYRNASRTVCYLGPEMKNKSRKAFAMLQELAEDGKSLQANDATRVPSFINFVPINPVQTGLRDKYVANMETMGLVVYMGECEWWSRAWTVQESLLSDNAVVVVGRRSIEWRDLCAAIDHGFNMQIWRPLHFGFVRDEVIVPYLSLRALESRQHRRHDQLSSPAHELLNLLIHCRHRGSENPRDKIYALLGLLRDVNSRALNSDHSQQLCIKPDYNLPVIDVYRQVSQELIGKLNNLDVLGVTPRSTLPGLPSWVTDWSVTDYISSPLTKDALDRERETNASKGTKGSFQFLTGGKTIILNGCEISSVHRLADQLRYVKITSTKVPLNMRYFDQKLTRRNAFEADLVQSINQTDDDANSSTLEQLLATPKNVYKTSQESSQGVRRSLRRIHGGIQDFGTARIIDRETFTGGVSLEDFANTFRTLFAWEEFSRADAPVPNGKIKPVKQTDNPSELYWQTICAGTYQDGSGAKTKALFDEWSQKLQPLRSLFDKHPQAIERRPLLAVLSYVKAFWTGYSLFWPYMACANGRRLGWAVNGWLCLVPGDTEVGDRIILARGGRVPLVIRPLAGHDGCFSFVGEAYIHGIMDGEAFVKEECKDIKIC